jgi:hypothetical protein
MKKNPDDTACGMVTILTAVLVPRRQGLSKRLLNMFYLFLASSS